MRCGTGQIGWSQTKFGMDVEPDANANVESRSYHEEFKQAMADLIKDGQQMMHQDKDRGAKDVKVKLDLLKKSDPNANAATMVAIKKLAAGDY